MAMIRNMFCSNATVRSFVLFGVCACVLSGCATPRPDAQEHLAKPLIRAVSALDIVEVRGLLDKGASPSCRFGADVDDYFGTDRHLLKYWTPLYALLELPKNTMDGGTRTFLEVVADVDENDAERVAPSRDELKARIATLLVDRGADPNVEIAYGFCVLRAAVNCKDYAFARHLIGLGARPDLFIEKADSSFRKPLLFAALRDPTLVQTLLGVGCDPKATWQGYGSLALALNFGYFESARVLLGDWTEIDSVVSLLNSYTELQTRRPDDEGVRRAVKVLDEWMERHRNGSL